jgi:hypothetical protein
MTVPASSCFLPSALLKIVTVPLAFVPVSFLPVAFVLVFPGSEMDVVSAAIILFPKLLSWSVTNVRSTF